MQEAQKELRYQRILRQIKDSRLWNGYVKYYASKTWGTTKHLLWVASTGAIVVLLPLALEATIEGEMQAQHISSQLGSAGVNPDIQYRPY